MTLQILTSDVRFAEMYVRRALNKRTTKKQMVKLCANRYTCVWVQNCDLEREAKQRRGLGEVH
jgi:hypothetical protein